MRSTVVFECFVCVRVKNMCVCVCVCASERRRKRKIEIEREIARDICFLWVDVGF